MTQPTAEAVPVKGSRVDTLLELGGLGCLVGFAYLVWAPAALLVLGLVLVVGANLRAARRRSGDRVRLVDRVARLVAAYRGAVQAAEAAAAEAEAKAARDAARGMS